MANAASPLAALELKYFMAVSLYRRRKYEECSEILNAILHTGHEQNVQMFAKDEEELTELQQQQQQQQQQMQQSQHSVRALSIAGAAQNRTYGSGGVANSNIVGGGGKLPQLGNRRMQPNAAQQQKTIMPTWLMEVFNSILLLRLRFRFLVI